jgi:TetR/AcrR family transcriptional regulator, fatty acid metabolism regulator protein
MKQEKLNTKIRQQQIADVCLGIISDRGLGALNVTEVASKLGLATSALYRHYKDKEQMISAMLQIIKKRVTSDFVSADILGRNAFEKLEQLLSIEPDRVQERRAFQMILLADCTFRQKYNKLTEVRSIVFEFRKKTIAIFEEGQQAGIIRKDITSSSLEMMFVNLFIANTAMQIVEKDEFDVLLYYSEAWAVFKETISAE